MHINMTVFLLLCFFILLARQGCQKAHAQQQGPQEQNTNTAPVLYASTLSVPLGQGVRLIGHHLIFGEPISGRIANGKYTNPMWKVYPDENGDLDLDITARWNINQSGPPAAQPYYFDAWQSGVSASFTVWYQTDDQHTNTWRSKNVAIDASEIKSAGQVRITAEIEPYNNYQVQAATNLSGPWKFVGNITYSDTNHADPSEATNLTSVFQVDPLELQMFFRVADPIGPCPYSFTNQP